MRKNEHAGDGAAAQDDSDDAVSDRDAQRKTRGAGAPPRSVRRAEAERKRARSAPAPASKAEAAAPEREPRKERGESSSRPDWGY